MTLREKFRSSIKRGTGEAHIILSENPEVNFSNIIIKASLHNYAHDPQSEGSRAVYIFDLIKLSTNKDKIRSAILNGIKKEMSETWDLVQLLDLAAIYAKQGDSEAKSAIYNRYGEDIIWGSDWAGESQITELDGFSGLKYIVEKKGKRLYNDNEYIEDDTLLYYFQEEHPELNVYDELDKVAQTSTYTKTYLEKVKALVNNRKLINKDRPICNYETIKKNIEQKKIVPASLSDLKKLSSNEIKNLADDFLKEKERIKLEKYMRIFDKIKYPYKDYQPILQVAKRKYSSKDRLIEYAVESLKNFTGKDIRQFALQKLSESKDKYLYTNLLVGNYKKGDSKLLVRFVQNSNKEIPIHSLAMSYIAIYDANDTEECQEPLEAIYDKLTCGIHREDIVRILIKNNVLSDRIKREIEFDSKEGIRELAKVIK